MVPKAIGLRRRHQSRKRGSTRRSPPNPPKTVTTVTVVVEAPAVAAETVALSVTMEGVAVLVDLATVVPGAVVVDNPKGDLLLVLLLLPTLAPVQAARTANIVLVKGAVMVALLVLVLGAVTVALLVLTLVAVKVNLLVDLLLPLATVAPTVLVLGAVKVNLVVDLLLPDHLPRAPLRVVRTSVTSRPMSLLRCRSMRKLFTL